jgi:hypothetical protein
MADNTELNPGVGGDVIASDDIGGVKYQRVKLGWGGDGVYNEVDASLPYPVSSYSAPLAPYSFTQAGAITINTDLLVIDCIGLKSLMVQCTSMGTSGVVTLQWSNDPSFNVIASASLFGSDGAIATTFNGAAVRVANVFARYARLRLTTAASAGTTTFAVWGSTEYYTPVTTTQGVSIASLPSLPAGTNLTGDNGVQYRANNTGAAGLVSVLSPATPAAATIKGSAGRLIGWQLHNGSTGVRSVKLFNATAPTLGTTAAVFEIDIPVGGRAEIVLDGGIGFATAMTYSVTAAKGLTDNTATGLAANDVSGSFFFA